MALFLENREVSIGELQAFFPVLLDVGSGMERDGEWVGQVESSVRQTHGQRMLTDYPARPGRTQSLSQSLSSPSKHNRRVSRVTDPVEDLSQL